MTSSNGVDAGQGEGAPQADGLSPTVEPVPVSPAVAASIPSADRLKSFSAGATAVCLSLDVPASNFIASIGRAKNLIRCGLFGNGAGRGKARPLSHDDYNLLLWGTLLTTSGIPPSVVTRALKAISPDELARDELSLELPSELGVHSILVSVRLPASAIEARRAETGTGSVHESAVAKPDAQGDPQ